MFRKLTKTGLLAMVALFMMPSALAAGTMCPNPDGSWPLTGGQQYIQGSVTVSNDVDTLYITYTYSGTSCTADGLTCQSDYDLSEIGTMHVGVYTSTDQIPYTGNKGWPDRPPSGQLPFHFSLDGQFSKKPVDSLATLSSTNDSVTLAIPVNEILLPDQTPECGQELIVLTHGEGGNGETVWGGSDGYNIGQGGAWFFADNYAWQCCDGPEPPDFCVVETAFAYGTHILAEEWGKRGKIKNNPDGLESLGIAKNRWGWAINLNSGSATQDIYAGAGLNDTSKGDLVGTLTVDWDGAVATVTYSLISGYYLEEVHVYAGDTEPTTIAPGQYGNPADYDVGGVQTFTTSIEVADTDGDGIWLIGHSVVSNGECD